MQEPLKAVCLRLSGKGGELSSIIRLGTQYGGGKTHALIALVHVVRGVKGVTNLSDFIDPSILPSGVVRITAPQHRPAHEGPSSTHAGYNSSHTGVIQKMEAVN
jgi:hypothetical protein